VNNSARWKAFLEWWKSLDIKKYEDELQLYADVWEKIDEIKGGAR